MDTSMDYRLPAASTTGRAFVTAIRDRVAITTKRAVYRIMVSVGYHYLFDALFACGIVLGWTNNDSAYLVRTVIYSFYPFLVLLCIL